MELKIAIPDGLHEDTADLVARFAASLAEKLHSAEKKYGYSNFWKEPKWEGDCVSALAEHLWKGDPRDVANYCAFMWHHQWSTQEAVFHCADLGLGEDETPAARIAELEVRVKELEAERDEFDVDALNLIHERDFAEEIGTKLADAVGEHFRVDVGEHSSVNDPRDMALAVLDGEYVTDSDTDRKLTASRAQVERLVEALRLYAAFAQNTLGYDDSDYMVRLGNEALADVEKERTK